MTDNTVHLIKKVNWYPKKRPKLQIDVLSCLALRGKLSKGQAEKILDKRHGDILKSFDTLEEKTLIKKSKNRIFGRGRYQYTYEITRNGIEILILDHVTSPLNFWKIMYGYCHNTNQEIEIAKLDEFFELYFQRYLPYYNTSLLSHLDIFNQMFQRWFNDFIKNINGISSEQKILEVIAIYPNLTFNELVKKTGLSPRIIKKVLHNHSMENFPHIITLRNEIFIYQNIVGKKYNKKYWDFFQHMLIKKKIQDGVCRYELTLFGIILLLKLLRYYNINNKENQYFNKLPFLEYFEKIINFNREKLPLIFEKWNLLKQIMNAYAVYNFDIIFEENIINFDERLSLSRGGNRELHYSIREIFLQTRMYLREFANAGQTCLLNYFASSIPEIKYNNKYPPPIDYLSLNYPLKDKPNINKTKNIKTKFEEIMILLHPVEQILEQPQLYNLDYGYNLLETYENEFANEISAFFYFNLYYDFDFNDIISKGTQKIQDNQSYLIPKECLSKILELDREISNFYLKWKRDIALLQNKIYDNLKHL